LAHLLGRLLLRDQLAGCAGSAAKRSAWALAPISVNT
jgi:hypothetical protein